MTSFTLFLSNFHFIRPWWFLALIMLFFALWLLRMHRFNHSPWNNFLPSHLSQVLVEGAGANINKKNNHFFSTQGKLIKPFIIGLLTITALAGPAWQKLPQPVYQTERGSVLIMDMSYSMYATDIKPNRLTRARYKAVDLLNKINEGDIGLIAYAGDAFVISPLTQDIKNIELLLPSLSPDIMPEFGANPFAALSLAHDMLINAGHIEGDIYWFTDDVDNEDISDIYDWSAKFGHRLNILGIGSQDGAPITLPSGELLKDSHGAIVVPKLPIQKLNALAKRGNGHYQTISHNENDIEKLIINNNMLEHDSKNEQQSQQSGDQWQEQGPWLLLMVLPLLLSYFRRGSAILILPLSCLPLLALLSFSIITASSFAAEVDSEKVKDEANAHTNIANSSELTQAWKSLWQTNDQQAQKRYNQQDFQGAAQQFENNQWQGIAHYKVGNYQQALDAFKQGEQANSANSLYNQGNALAQLQQFEQAIEHYEQALTKNPDLQDAKDNIEKIKQQQKEQKQEQEQQGDQSKDPQEQQQKNNNDKQQEQQQDSQDQQSQNQKNKQEQQQSDNGQQQNDANTEPQEKEPQQNKSHDSNQEQKEQQKSQQQQEATQSGEESTEQGKEKTAAQIAAEQQTKEKEQKHQQLLNKVTDDPYLLLRNKMQLEYQKRKQSGASQGAKKKW